VITFSTYISNVAKLYAQLTILNLNDFYKLQIANLMHISNMTVCHLLLTIYSQSWTLYIHIILDKKHQEYIVPRKKIGDWTKISYLYRS